MDRVLWRGGQGPPWGSLWGHTYWGTPRGIWDTGTDESKYHLKYIHISYLHTCILLPWYLKSKTLKCSVWFCKFLLAINFFFFLQKCISKICIIAWIIYYWSEFLVFMALKTCTTYTQFTNFMTIIPVVSLEQTLCYRTGSGLSVCGTRSSCGWPETAAPGGRHICSHTTWPRIYIGLSVAAHQKKKG